MIAFLVSLLLAGIPRDVPRPPAKPQVVGRMEGKFIIDSETVFTLDGKWVGGVDAIPKNSLIVEIEIDADNRVRVMKFQRRKEE